MGENSPITCFRTREGWVFSFPFFGFLPDLWQPGTHPDSWWIAPIVFVVVTL